LADKDGRPISIEAYPGNEPDSAVLVPTADNTRKELNFSRLVAVGNIAIISENDITALKETGGVDWTRHCVLHA
jgi:transposase